MRTPITLKIKFKSSSLDQFIERYSVDVSRGGIFIRTKEPLPVGTTLRFEFQLQDGSSLIGGEGTVVWNRAHDPARSGVAPGMGVRFDKLTADSQRVLERILGEKHRRGEAQLESRFDAGVRASREAQKEYPGDQVSTPLPAPSPGMGMSSGPSGSYPGGVGHGVGGGGHGGGFGDEPTKMMAADQMNQLAEAMQHEEDFSQDQPTRRATLEEIQRAFAAPEAGGGRPGAEPVRIAGTGSPPLPRGVIAPQSKTSAMGMVNPFVAAGTLPTPSSGEHRIPASLTTRPVSAEETAALLRTAASEATPQKDLQHMADGLRSPDTPRDPYEPETLMDLQEPQPIAIAMAATMAPMEMAQTLVDAQMPPMPQGMNGLGMQTLVSPPPAEFLQQMEQLGRARTVPPPPSTRSPVSPPPAARPLSPAQSIGVDLSDLNTPAPHSLGPEYLRGAPAPGATIRAYAPNLDAPAPPAAPASEVALQAIPMDRYPREPLAPRPPEATKPPGRSAPLMGLFFAVALAGVAIYALVTQRHGMAPETDQPPVERKAAPPEKALPEKAAPPEKALPEKAAPPEKALPEKAASPEKAPPEKAASPEKAPPEKKPEKAPDVRPAVTKPAEGKDPGERPAGEKKPAEAAVAEPGELQSVTVKSEPAGARIELAGKVVGETPVLLVDLVPGKNYEVKLVLRGYQDNKFKFKPGDKTEKMMLIKLVPYERVAEISSTPRGGDVYLDGKKVGRAPFVIRHLDMSKIHEVEVRKAGYQSSVAKIADTDTFDVRNGREVRSLNLVLEAIVGGPKDDRRAPAREGKRQAPKDGDRQVEPEKPEASRPPPAEGRSPPIEPSEAK